jgi:hypothetical protein
MNDRLRGLLNEVTTDSVDSARDRATWEGASQIEQATFGKVFNAIEGVLAIIALFGCAIISGATQNSQFLMYVVGIIWIVPFILVGTLLARFRHRLFVRLRGTINTFLGGKNLK